MPTGTGPTSRHGQNVEHPCRIVPGLVADQLVATRLQGPRDPSGGTRGDSIAGARITRSGRLAQALRLVDLAIGAGGPGAGTVGVGSARMRRWAATESTEVRGWPFFEPPSSSLLSSAVPLLRSDRR